MKRVLLTSFLAVAACATPALAEDFVATAEIEGKVADISGNPSKFQEYRDLDSGVTGRFLLDWSDERGYFLNLSGDKIGFNAEDNEIQRDSEVLFNVGLRDQFKYSLFYKETPHNLSLGARSGFTGIGSSALVSTLAITDGVAAIAQYYNKPTFNYTMDRRDYGAEAEFSFNSPFFVSARFEHNETNGLLPMGAMLNSAAKELPAPIDYSSDNVYLTAGYRSNGLIVTLDGTISDFKNSNSSFAYSYTDSAVSTQRTYLAPDSMHYKVGGNVMYRMPFWSSTLMARASHSISENTVGLSDEVLTTPASINSFKGKITYTTVSTAFTTNPIKPLDIKLYLNYLDKQNKSSEPFQYYSGAPTALQIAGYGTTETFDYSKLNGGFDIGYKLPAKTKLAAGYEYLRIKRVMYEPDPANPDSWGVRNDAPKTEDHIVYLQAKNELLDWMTAKVRYQRLFRSSDFRGDLFAGLTDNRLIKAFWRPADTADKTQDMVKVGFDFEPTSNLSVGVEYSLKHNDYTDSILGMQRDTRNEFYADVNYRIAMVKLQPYAELEVVNNNSKHRRYQTAGAATPYSAVNDVNNYNWTSDRKDVNYALGLKSDVDIIKDKLTFAAGYRFEKADGEQDFTTSFPIAALTNNTYVDNYTKNSLTANLKYNVTKNLHVGLGYLFESLRYTDNHYEGYDYMLATTGSTQLTGAYANPDFDAHVAFMTVGYKF